MTNYSVKRRRASAVIVKIPLILKLYYINLITLKRIDLLVKKPFAVFVNYECENKVVKISIIHFDYSLNDYKEHVICRSEDNWYFAFKELLTYLSTISQSLKIKKKEFFVEQLKFLRNISVKRGYLNSCRIELDKYVTKLSVFTFHITHDFNVKLVMTLNYLKRNNKSHKFTSKIDDDGNFLSISNKDFYMRDISNFFGLDLKSECSSSLELITRMNEQNGRVGINNLTFLQNVALFYNDFNTWLSKHYFGQNLTFSNVTSASILSYYISSQENISNNPLDLALLKISLSDLELFSSNNQGGLTFNCLKEISSGDQLRPHFGVQEPVKNVLSYDIRSAYGHAILNSKIPVGNSLHYKLNSVDQKLYLHKDMCIFTNERNSIYAILYITYKTPNLEIVTSFHSFNSNGQFTIGKYGIDLVIIVKEKTQKKKFKLLIYQIDGKFTHGCLNCHTDNSKYINNKSFQQVYEESEKKHSELEIILQTQFQGKENYSFNVIKTCCHFNDFYDPVTKINYPSLKDFFVNTSEPLLQKFKLYFNEKKSYTTSQIIEAISGPSKIINFPFENAFIMCNVSIPKEEMSTNFGYIISKHCLSCKNPNIVNNKHQLRLVAANYTQFPTLFHIDVLRYLAIQKKAKICDITHVICYPTGDNTCLKPYIEKTLNLRQLVSENKALSTFLKCLCNSLLGLYQWAPFKRNTKTVITTHIDKSRLISTKDNPILHCKLLGTLFGLPIYSLKIAKNSPSWGKYYFSQIAMPVASSILQQAKLQILKIYNMFDTYADPNFYRLGFFNTDSLLFFTSSSTPSILPWIKPHLLQQFKKDVYTQYFSDKKDCNSLGKLLLEQFSDNRNFTFISPNSRTYVIHYLDDENTTSNSIIKGFRKNAPLNKERMKFLEQKDRKPLHNNYDSIPM